MAQAKNNGSVQRRKTTIKMDLYLRGDVTAGRRLDHQTETFYLSIYMFTFKKVNVMFQKNRTNYQIIVVYLNLSNTGNLSISCLFTLNTV